MRGSPPSSVLKLGISSGVPSSRLAALLALHRAKEPETPVSMEEVTSSPDLIEGVKNGRYDIGLVATTTPADDAPLWREELAVAVPDRSPLLRYAAIPLGALLSLVSVLPPGLRSAVRSRVARSLRGHVV